ncbi:MAG: EAL domain-containing protein [Pseudohongiella sp.]|nr:EAL domain-containing protein [Pseudohongiella sp.]MDP2127298.1 EAL domain-containing protein [Pseudohongiella sp.]
MDKSVQHNTDDTISSVSPLVLALLYAVFAGAWILLSGYLLVFVAEDPSVQARAELAKGLGFVLVTSLLLHRLLRNQLVLELNEASIGARRSQRRSLLVAGSMLLLVPLIGIAIVRIYGPAQERNIGNNLQAIAQLQANQVEHWHQHRLSDAAAMASNRFFLESVYYSLQGDTEAAVEAQTTLQTVVNASGYSALLLTDAQLQPVLMAGQEIVPGQRITELLSGPSNQGVRHTSLYQNELGRPVLDFLLMLDLRTVAPTEASQQDAIAYLILRTDPEQTLFPLILEWPGASQSAETMLVQQYQGELVYLTPSRDHTYSSIPAITITHPHLVAAEAARTRATNWKRGVDYRNVDVLGAYAPVDNTDWVIVSKVDRAEALAGVTELAYWVSLIVFVALTAMAATLVMLWLQQRRVYQLILQARRAEENITRRESMLRIEHLASHDSLTDLPNRIMLVERIRNAIINAEQNKQSLAILFIDLDKFKLVNDSLGHDCGDIVLKETALRIRRVLSRDDSASRVGGDEFVVLLPLLHSVDQATQMASRLVSEIACPIMVNSHDVILTASVGIALYPEHSKSAEDLLRLADMAMLSAKQAGRNQFHFVRDEQGTDAGQRLQLLHDLHNAVSKQQLRLHYQPQFNLRDNTLVGLEALLRWQRNDKTLVSPGEFIPLAEDTGLILPIGAWTLQESCRQAAIWRRQGLLDCPVAVNVSALQFRQPNFVDHVIHAIESHNLPPDALELELTESVVMMGMNHVRNTLARLIELNVQFAIDDFGTGYSSLSYLRQFPAQRLKIDQSFVSALPDDPDAAAITRAIVSLGHTLGMVTIAEGVETQAQADFLREIGCEQGQGFLFSKPLPIDLLEPWLDDHKSRNAH